MYRCINIDICDDLDFFNLIYPTAGQRSPPQPFILYFFGNTYFWGKTNIITIFKWVLIWIDIRNFWTIKAKCPSTQTDLCKPWVGTEKKSHSYYWSSYIASFDEMMISFERKHKKLSTIHSFQENKRCDRHQRGHRFECRLGAKYLYFLHKLGM